MPKIRGPLFSLGAQGSIGKELTFRKQRDRQHAQRHFTPRDAKSESQLAIRKAMHELQLLWKVISQRARDNWNNYAREAHYRNQSGYSLFLKENFEMYLQTGFYEQYPDWDMPIITLTGQKVYNNADEQVVFNGA